jgi:type I restriction enzyme R subunit
MTPETKARQQIDQKLGQAGWVIQDMKQLNLAAAAWALPCANTPPIPARPTTCCSSTACGGRDRSQEGQRG